MANKKISELTSVTLPLAGTEEIPIVQSGETKKIAASDLVGVGATPRENYIFEYASQSFPTTTNWQVSNYNSSQRDNLFRNNTATTYPTLNQDVGGHYVRKTGNVTKIIFKMLRRNPALTIDFDVYVAKFVKADGDIGFGAETIIANQNISSGVLTITEGVIREFTLLSTAVTEGEHLYIALRNNTGVAVTLYDAQVIIITE